MSRFVIVKEYPRRRPIVWQALTDPALIPLWTSTGQGGRPEGFKPEIGNHFSFVGKPFPGWNGIVLCQVLAVDEPSRLRYSWRNKESDPPSIVTNHLDETPTGTRLTYEHSDFHGLEGLFMSKILGRIRRRMLSEGFPAALDTLDDEAGCFPAESNDPKDESRSRARWPRPDALDPRPPSRKPIRYQDAGRQPGADSLGSCHDSGCGVVVASVSVSHQV